MIWRLDAAFFVMLTKNFVWLKMIFQAGNEASASFPGPDLSEKKAAKNAALQIEYRLDSGLNERNDYSGQLVTRGGIKEDG